MSKEQIRVEIARIINASCIDPPTRGEPDRPADCPADCGLCKADQILALFSQSHWVFKTDKLTPLQVMACVCQQCPFPGELETRCSWCDHPKMVEFLRLALSAIDDFYTQENKIDGNALPSAAYDEYFTPPQVEGEHIDTSINKILEKWFKDPIDVPCAYCEAAKEIEQQLKQHEANALKEQMERVMGVIDRQRDYKPKYHYKPKYRRKSGITGGE